MEGLTVTLPGLSVFVEFEYRHFAGPEHKVINARYRGACGSGRLVVTDETICYISTTVVDGVPSRDHVGIAECSVKDRYNWMTGNKLALKRAAQSLWYDAELGSDAFKNWSTYFPTFFAALLKVVAPTLAVQRRRRSTLAQRHRDALNALRLVASLCAAVVEEQDGPYRSDVAMIRDVANSVEGVRVQREVTV